MNKLFAGKSGPKVKVGQLLFSNLIISPVMNSGKKKLFLKKGIRFINCIIVYLTAMAILADVRSPAKLKANIKAGLLPMQKVSWVVSPLTLVFAQSFLPPTTWVPFFNLVAFGKL